jgi:uncharacterized integral membrane protein
MRFGLILLVLVFAGAGAVFGALNSQPVTFDFYFGSVSLARGGALLGALLAGWLLGGLLVWFSLVMPLRVRLRRLSRQHRQMQADAVDVNVDKAPVDAPR